MTDIVERLRSLYTRYSPTNADADAYGQAADEIERLTKDNTRQRHNIYELNDEIERLRADVLSLSQAPYIAAEKARYEERQKKLWEENECLRADLAAMEVKRNTASVNLMQAIDDTERLRVEINRAVFARKCLEGEIERLKNISRSV